MFRLLVFDWKYLVGEEKGEKRFFFFEIYWNIWWWDGCVQPLGRIATLLVLVSVHVWSVWILMKMDHLEDSFDLLILITSNWWDPRRHQPLYRQVWAKKVKASNTSTTSKKSQLVFKKIIYWPRALLCPPARGWSPTRPPCPPAGPPRPPADISSEVVCTICVNHDFAQKVFICRT